MGNNDSAKFTLNGWPSTSSTNGCCKQPTCLFAVYLFYVRKPTFIVKCTVCRVSLMAIAAAQLSGDLCASHCQLQKFKSSSFKWIIITGYHARGPGFDYHSRHTRVIPRSFQLNKPIQPHTNHDQKTSMLTRRFIS